jgi:mono/diheme cytochrome c family protein
MRHPSFTLLPGFVLLVGLTLPFLSAADPKPPKETSFSAEQLAFYEKQVQPILKAHCLKCHGEGKKLRGNLNLTSRSTALKGGDLGPAVILEKPESSPLLHAVNFTEGLEMPPSGKLAARDIEVLTRWVKMGAPYPAGTTTASTTHETGGVVTPESRAYWAYQPVKRPPVPKVKDAKWVSNPIDAFLLARIEAKGLHPAGPADKLALVRRVYYDLIGLPPTPAEVDAFVNDPRANAYEQLVEKLLASPQYGEKWGRHWLDLVRYAETHGYERDGPKPEAWRYRDYVIKAFNDDKPYDRFLLEQLAGDELPRANLETLAATGFYRLGIWDDEPADRLQARYEVLDGLVVTTSQVFLGMTVGCARCHDHKKDPIPQKDYYRLLAFFQDVTDMDAKNLRVMAGSDAVKEQQRLLSERQARETKLYEEIYGIEQRVLAGLVGKPGGPNVSQFVSDDLFDLRYRFYRDTWETLPDFDALKFEAQGSVVGNRFTLAPASRQEAIGLVFTGKLQVRKKASYSFRVNASEGVRLIVNGKRVINEPGKGRHSAEGEIELPVGAVDVRLEYFNSHAIPELHVTWSGPDFRGRVLSEVKSQQEQVLMADSRKAGQKWKYTTKFPSADWPKPNFKADSWAIGTGGFGTVGTPGAQVRTEWSTNDIWIRRSFSLEAIPEALALDLHHDDEVEIFLNGELLHQARGYTVEYDRVDLGPAALKALHEGENVLAVHCHQTTGGQYIDLGLVVPAVGTPADLARRHGRSILGAEVMRRYDALRKELEASRKVKIPMPGTPVMCVAERGNAPTHVLIRGNPTSQGAQVTAGFPEVLTGETPKLPKEALSSGTSGKRLALAEWLTRKDNPLTARVMANRLWQYHFGRGIVPSSSDFGKLGESPTHPELLDWLASEFVARNWSIKSMHRLIMTSSAYRMASHSQPSALKADPANHLFWRFPMRRLTAEEVRDSILMASGKLNLKAGGPSIYPPIPKEVLAGQSVPGQGWHTSNSEESCRRSVYVHIKRSLQVPILATHDQADTDSSCAVRYTTTVPTQALGMLNGDFTNEQATVLADRVRREVPGDPAGQVARIIRLTSGRTPTEEEVKRDLAFIEKAKTRGKLDDVKAMDLYALMALNMNEFVYLD